MKCSTRTLSFAVRLMMFSVAPLLAQNERFNGLWKYDASEYTLRINLKDKDPAKRIYLFSSKLKDTTYKSIVYSKENEIMVRTTATDGIYYTKYKFNDNDELVCLFQEINYEIVYKRSRLDAY